jgi:SAM-dependent methyltransferase
MPETYKLKQTAESFAHFCEQQNGEKALLWSQLRLRVMEQITDNARPRCLDYGCGCSSGWFANRLAEEFQVFAYGYDPEPAMIEQCKKNSVREFFVSDFEHIKDAGPYDLAFCVYVIPAISGEGFVRAAFRQMAEVLSTGGRVCVAGINPDTLKTDHQFFTSHIRECARAGAPYKTLIRIEGAPAPMLLTDYYWPARTIVAAGSAAGLHLIQDSFLADGCSDNESLNFPYRIWDFVKI